MSSNRSARTRALGATALAAGMLALAACSGGGGAAAGGGGGGAASGDAEGVTLKVQEIFSPGDTFADSTKAWGDYVTEATDGAVEMEYFWGNSIAPTNELAAAMRDGLVDVGRQQPPAAPADFPVMNWLSEAASLNTAAMPAGLLQKVGAHMEFVMNSEQGTPVIEGEMGDLGIRPLGAFAIVQQYDMLCKKPLETLADFEGVKVRVAGQAWVEEAENLGMEPVTLLPEEIYEGYQRGIVDCVMTYPTHWIATGLWELGGYYVPVKLNGWNQDGLTISESAWQKLDADQQRAAYEGTRAWLKQFLQTQLDGYWTFLTQMGDHGISSTEPEPAVQEKIDAHHDGVVADMVDTAPARVEDPQAFLDEYVALSDKWLGIVEDLGFTVDGEGGASQLVDALEDPTRPPSEQIDLDPWLDAVMEASYGAE